MKTFVKKIVRSNKYTIPGKTPRVEEVSPQRINSWANTANKMIQAGLKIPAPINHDFQSLPVTVGPDGLSDAAKNSGFWTKFFTKQENGHTALYGHLEVPDALSEKVGQTITETSIYVRPTFTDGLGREWKDAPMHVALVNNPIEPDQSNFQPVEQGSLALSMSMEQPPAEDIGDPKATSTLPSDPQTVEQNQNQTCNISELLAQLREVAGIDLLEDTLPDNLAERLLAALRQKRLSELEDEESEGTTRQPPNNSREPSRPIIMSNTPTTPNLTPEQVNELVMAHPAYKESREAVKNLLHHISENARRGFQRRIQQLVQAGVCTKEYAESKLAPLVAQHQVAFQEDGKSAASTVEILLEGLEAVKPSQTPELAMSHPTRIPFANTVVPGQDWASIQRSLAMSMGQNVNDLQIQEPPGPKPFNSKDADEVLDELFA
jgi:hypothetical protein